jgi:arylsulfatase A-like enzyme/Flp pilus assembly protein TadD
LWPIARAPQTRSDFRGVNVLLVTIDTLRADRIGAYGSRAGLTPTLDALAAGGVRFTRVWSHAPVTLPAHASILTGLLPPRHGVRNNGSFRLGLEPATLAERLRAAGYRTGAFVGAFVLDTRFGLNRGFHKYDDRYDSGTSSATFHFAERSADRVLSSATAWITEPESGHARPWFAWVHLFDPHAPYRAPAPFAHARAPYDAEVAWTDSALGTALNELRSRGQLDRTLVIVTADHGESLGDHRETTHGLFAYDATLRVPLIIAAPGLRPRVVSTPASHVDIMPTVLDLLAIESPSGLDGRSLRPDIDEAAEINARAIYFEALDANLTRGWAPLRGIVDGTWKYIDLPEPELYNLDTDPNEQTNLVGREPQRVGELQDRLREWTAAPIPAGGKVDSATAARLQSLGYITASPRTRAGFALADDPKRLVALSETFNTALDDYSSGRADAALEKFSQVLADRPDFLAARLSAGTVLITTGRAAAAVSLLRDAPASDKSTPAWLTRMGQSLAAAGELREAQAVLAEAVTATSGDPEPLNELGVVLLRLGETDQARRAFERLLEANPTASGTWYNVGLLELGAQRPAEAAAAFRRVVELDKGHADAWRGLGAALAASDATEAIDAWKHVVELEPRDFDTVYNLGVLLAETGRRTEALPYLQRFLAEAPRDRYAPDFPRIRALLARSGNPS